MLCGDIKGIGRLTDPELPRFVKTVPGAFARAIERYGAAVRLSDSSGDRTSLVFADAGKDVSRAARIEPVTPEGFVYLTEALAAVLAIEHADELECD